MTFVNNSIVLSIDDLKTLINHVIENSQKDTENKITNCINKEFAIGQYFAYMNLLENSPYIDDLVKIHEAAGPIIEDLIKEIDSGLYRG